MYTRRAIVGGMAGLAASAPIAPLFAARPALKRPPALRPGDTVGLVAPAGFVGDRFGLEEIEHTIRAMGLVPKTAPNLLARYGYLAGTDRERANALNAMFADDEVRAIFAVRGGWGCARLLPHLDYAPIRNNPKLLIGSSDITALHMALAARTRIPSIHGPNASHSWPELTWHSFWHLAFAGATPTYENPQTQEGRLFRERWPIRTFRSGVARGPLLGGNLSVLTALVGTPYLPAFDGAILFLEDTNEAEYRIDRMLTQLSLSGILGRVAGVVFGQCTNCTNPGTSFSNFTVYEVLEQHLAPLGVPAFQGALIGHIAQQYSIPVGVEAEIDAGKGTIRVLEPVVRKEE